MIIVDSKRAATQLVAPTHASGALDVVCGDGFSALLWAEERGWDGVTQSLGECGAVPLRLAIVVVDVYYCSDLLQCCSRGGRGIVPWDLCYRRHYETRLVWTSLPITH